MVDTWWTVASLRSGLQQFQNQSLQFLWFQKHISDSTAHLCEQTGYCSVYMYILLFAELDSLNQYYTVFIIAPVTSRVKCAEQ